jgi:hypothetical protein
MADHCKSCGAPMPCRCCRIYRGVLNADGYGVVNRGQCVDAKRFRKRDRR